MENNLIYWSKKLYEQGLSPAKSGNISVLKENSILITTSGSACMDLSENEIVEMDFAGNSLEEGKKPSSEKFMHVAIYKTRPDIKAIIHCHTPEITAFAVSGMEIKKPVLPEFALQFGKIPLAKYYLPSTMELAIEVAKYFKSKNAVLMENHGVVVGAKNLREAFFLVEAINAYCKTCLYAKLLGKINPLNKKQLMEINKLK